MMKRIITITAVLFLLVIIIGGCSNINGGSDSSISKPQESELTEEERKLVEKYAFLTSFEGEQCQTKAYQFFRAFILADIETIKSLLADPDNTGAESSMPSMKRSLDDCTKIVFRINEYIPTEENIGKVYIQYVYSVLEFEMQAYLSIHLDYIDGEWKITRFYSDI